MRFLILDTNLRMSLAHRLKTESHSVFYSSTNPNYAKGMFEHWGIERVEHFTEVLGKVDCVISCDPSFGSEVDYIRRIGLPVFGPGGYEAKLQQIPEFAKKVTEAIGLRYGQPEEGGQPFWVGGFFDGTEFAQPILCHVDYDKLMPGDVGPRVGEMGTILYYQHGGKVYDEILAKLTPWLKQVHYRGFIDVICVINHEGPWIIGYDCQLDLPHSLVQLYLHEDGIGELYYKVAKGQAIQFEASDKWGVGVSWVTYPRRNIPLPIDMDETTEQDNLADLVGVDFQDGKYLLQPNHNLAVICPGTGRSLAKAQAAAYGVVNGIHFPDGLYRNDIGHSLYEVREQLADTGWLPMERYKTLK